MKDMKTLYDRLIPEAASVINDEQKMYPYTISCLVEDLKKNRTNIGYLRYDTILGMASIPKLRVLMGLKEHEYSDSLMYFNLKKLFNI